MKQIKNFEKHPLNIEFDWNPPSGPYRRISVDQAQSWSEKGFFVLEDAFDALTIKNVLAELDPKEEIVESNLQKVPGGKMFINQAGALTFTVRPVASSNILHKFAGDVVFGDLCHDLIGPDARLYWDQAVYKKTQIQQEFPCHQDNGYIFVEPQQYVTCWGALTDATLENGCPWVVPGVHKQGTLVHKLTDLGWQCFRNPEGAVPVPVKAGSIVVFSSLTPRRTGPNQTDKTRKAYILQYAPEGVQKLITKAGADYKFWAATQKKFREEQKTGKVELSQADTAGEPSPEYILQNDPKKQFLVIQNGKYVST